MISNFLFISCCLLVFSFANASLFSSCSNAKAIDQLDAGQIGGAWYLASTRNLPASNCSRNYLLVSNMTGVVTALNLYIDDEGMQGSDTMNFMLDPNGSGEVTSEIPEPHWLLRLLGIHTKRVTTNIIGTDYESYIIWCTCNDNSFWRSYDEVSIAVRDKNPAVGQAIVSKILLNGIENGQLSAKELKEFEEVEQGEECNVLPF